MAEPMRWQTHDGSTKRPYKVFGRETPVILQRTDGTQIYIPDVSKVVDWSNVASYLIVTNPPPPPKDHRWSVYSQDWGGRNCTIQVRTQYPVKEAQTQCHLESLGWTDGGRLVRWLNELTDAGIISINK